MSEKYMYTIGERIKDTAKSLLLAGVIATTAYFAKDQYQKQIEDPKNHKKMFNLMYEKREKISDIVDAYNICKKAAIDISNIISNTYSKLEDKIN